MINEMPRANPIRRAVAASSEAPLLNSIATLSKLSLPMIPIGGAPAEFDRDLVEAQSADDSNQDGDGHEQGTEFVQIPGFLGHAPHHDEQGNESHGEDGRAHAAELGGVDMFGGLGLRDIGDQTLGGIGLDFQRVGPDVMRTDQKKGQVPDDSKADTGNRLKLGHILCNDQGERIGDRRAIADAIADNDDADRGHRVHSHRAT